MNALIPWIGGKRLLRKEISKYVPRKINGYIEPFGGAGWMLLYKDKWADLEVYNDLDNRLTNMFLQVKYHPEELLKELSLMLSSRTLFYQIISQPGLTEIQKAARFIYIICKSFGSKGEHFGTSQTRGISSIQNRLDRIKDLNQRLDKVLIENKTYQDILRLYDTKDNFFYLDPPYTEGCTYDNAKNFNHQELRDLLKKVKGRFILSYDDSPLVRELYAKFYYLPVVRIKGINRKEGKSDYNELIIANFPLEEK